MSKGKLFIFSAPSGSGKSTIVKWLMEEHPELDMHFSISYATRAPRDNEENGVDYFFITPEEFRAKIAEDAFVEYQEVYADNFYGTPKSQVISRIENGENVAFDIDVKGGCNVKKMFGDQALSLFIQPPSIEELRRRLYNRGTDAADVIEKRLAKAAEELTYADRFDVVIVNDDLEKAKAEALKAIQDFLG